MFTDLNAGTAVPNHPTGWEAPQFTAVSFTVPDNWKAGRIWVCSIVDCYRYSSDIVSRPDVTAILATTQAQTHVLMGGATGDYYVILILELQAHLFFYGLVFYKGCIYREYLQRR